MNRASSWSLPLIHGGEEASDADAGVACGDGSGVVFVHGEVVRKVPEEEIVEALMETISAL